MRKRERKKKKTRDGHNTRQIVDIVNGFAMLHAYGVGLDVFHEVPVQDRMKSIDYAKVLLAYYLDDEIDSACRFLDALGAKNAVMHPHNYVRVSYLMHMYQYWQTLSGRGEKHVPLGCFIVAGMLFNQRIGVRDELRPDALLTVPTGKRKYIEDYLTQETDFVKPADEYIFYNFLKNEDRGGEQEN